jgi:mannitol-1-phosphate 5-dehydrogenase
MNEVAIFGAGKIARGFLAHLLSLSDIPFFFIEKDRNLTRTLNERGAYSIHVMGHSEKDCTISGFQTFPADEPESWIDRLARTDLLFTSVGGQNLTYIADPISRALQIRFESGIDRAMNIITCENWIDPAKKMKSTVLALLPPEMRDRTEKTIGFAESVILRSATDSEPERLKIDPLVVNVQDYWSLPVDAKGLKGTLPRIHCVEVKEHFAGMLTRKLFTYNAANGSASYLGYLRGHERLDEAAADQEILSVLMKVYEETSFALAKEFDITYEEEYVFSMTSLAKLCNPDIVDFIVRNARDPIRKLGPEDRLVGPALLSLKYGLVPEGLATAIAAAIHYSDPRDPVALELKRIRNERGIDFILDEICALSAHPEFKHLIHDKISELTANGWIWK